MFDNMSMYDSMNNSVRRANAEMDARRRALWGRADAESDMRMADANFARDMASRQFNEGGRQFDSRMNVLREILGRRSPDFYGGQDQGAPAQSAGSATMTVGGVRPGGDMGSAIQNYLMRFLRG